MPYSKFFENSVNFVLIHEHHLESIKNWDHSQQLLPFMEDCCNCLFLWNYLSLISKMILKCDLLEKCMAKWSEHCILKSEEIGF